MTKQDFQLIAEVIRELPLDRAADRETILNRFAERLAFLNARFDYARFKRACLGETGQIRTGDIPLILALALLLWAMIGHVVL